MKKDNHNNNITYMHTRVLTTVKEMYQKTYQLYGPLKVRSM